MDNFKIGDKVKATRGFYKDWSGKIISFKTDNKTAIVEFENKKLGEVRTKDIKR